MNRFVIAGAAAVLLAASPAHSQSATSILNSSYDIAREIFADINAAFVPAYKAATGQDVTVDQSHGGTSAQARSIAEGLEADVVTFNQVTDIEFLVGHELVAENWQERLPNNASPWYSFPSFLVREGNPKAIANWDDLARDDVQIVFPNPKTSGNARYTYLAATAYGLEAFGGDEEKVAEFVGKIFDNVAVFDTGGRGATTTFVEREIGDVIITFEAETRGIEKEFGEDRFDSVVPEVSLLAEFPVALVDKVAEKRGSTELATAYLEFLYSEEAQRIAAQRGHRINNETVKAEFADQFPEVRLVTVEDVFGGWEKVQAEHFASGGKLDEIFGDR